MGQNPGEISILLACHGMMSSELYCQALNRCTGFRVVARAATVSNALQAVCSNEIQLALVSPTLEDGPLSGIIALQQIQQACPIVRSIVLLERDESHLATAAFRAGAKGVFSPANEGVKSLCRCVRQVCAGQIWANSAQLQEVMEAFSRRAPVHLVSAEGARLLTKREEEVVQLVADGLTNRQIAKELELSEHTVKNNLFRVFDKLGVSSRVELALYAVNHSKLAPPQEFPTRKQVAVTRSSKSRSEAAS
jgi:DNA-binding NarL/FixJ family response regulator